MEKRPETKQEKLIFDSIARHYDEWIDIYAIAKDTRMIPADCDKYPHQREQALTVVLAGYSGDIGTNSFLLTYCTGTPQIHEV